MMLKRIKYFMLILLCLGLGYLFVFKIEFHSSVPHYMDVGTFASGNISCSYDMEKGILTLSGTGELNRENFDYQGFQDEYFNALLLNPLNEIRIEEGITAIGENVFHGAYVRKVVMADSVTRVGAMAFAYCSMEELVMSKELTYIDNGAFQLCFYLENVRWSEKLEHVGTVAFGGCPIKNLYIPACVDRLPTMGVPMNPEEVKAESVVVEEGNPYFNIDEQGVLYNEDMTVLKMPLITGITDLVIPDTVTEIAYSAFRQYSDLQTIRFPESLEDIGQFAFEGCEALQMVELPDSLQRIEDSAFENCVGLKSVTIPQSIYSIGTSAFSNCTSMGTLEFTGRDKDDVGTMIGSSTLQTVGESAFESCTALEEVTLPASVTCIETFAFANCSALRGVHFEGNAPVLRDNVFVQCAPDLRISYVQGTTGWTDPAWRGFSLELRN